MRKTTLRQMLELHRLQDVDAYVVASLGLIGIDFEPKLVEINEADHFKSPISRYLDVEYTRNGRTIRSRIVGSLNDIVLWEVRDGV